ncbi:5-oxoprolinase subunit PxpA [Microbacterium sp. SLBN-146]|uniref:5-oxoprolinase subunit PxpA n=1 Tax=Microbacterium sp. SLBN-146 TaxID=2768457 RepID=UPI001151C5A0|nr:5-oxoprolinase subunit PxpA [Microbacterium sp. SLBN-146]TQJ29776.1 UPF0271 protein [Microbacterium sp. SLBN-146]
MASIDLNADLGETVDGVPTADDDAMFAVVSSANIACGGHAGDAASMRASVERAARTGVAVGAHPSFPDPANFGRIDVRMPSGELETEVARQLARLVAAGADIRYVKPHGALYHAVSRRIEDAAAVASAVAALSERLGRALPLLGMEGPIEAAARAAGLPFVREAFLDRGYRPDGTLVPRGEPGAVLQDPDAAAARALDLAHRGTLVTVEGRELEVDAVSLCLHGDSPAAVAMASAVRAALESGGVAVRAPW